MFGGWTYAYSRQAGALGNPNSAIGQINTGATSNPANIRGDTGSVNPLALYTFGGDWTPTSRLVVSSRYSYFFSNNEDRGRPTGLRYLYNQNYTVGTQDLKGTPLPTGVVNGSPLAAGAGFNNMPSNLQTQFDAYKRNGYNFDASYIPRNFLGSHTLKGGYSWSRQSNDVLRNFVTDWVTMDWITRDPKTNAVISGIYNPLTSNTACDAIKAQNIASGLPGVCAGEFGFFTVGNGVINTGGDKTYSNAL
jgi:hypothetical protein